MSQKRIIKLLQTRGTMSTTNISFSTFEIAKGAKITSPILIKKPTLAYKITMITVFTKIVIPIQIRHYIT